MMVRCAARQRTLLFFSGYLGYWEYLVGWAFAMPEAAVAIALSSDMWDMWDM
jgi:hypothetical protein